MQKLNASGDGGLLPAADIRPVVQSSYRSTGPCIRLPMCGTSDCKRVFETLKPLISSVRFGWCGIVIVRALANWLRGRFPSRPGEA
jgi:hypothetical protein